MVYTTTCILNGQEVSREIHGLTPAMVRAWKNGQIIQDAMPNIPPEDREFIMTGITPELWEATFGPEPTFEENNEEEDA